MGRYFLMLTLVAALLLPPGLQRDCCCSKRVAVKKADQAPLRLCCRAKLQSVAKKSTQIRNAGSLVREAPCQCKQPASVVATLEGKHGRIIPELMAPAALPTDIVSTDELAALNVGSCDRNSYLIGPPLRITLCRWVV